MTDWYDGAIIQGLENPGKRIRRPANEGENVSTMAKKAGTELKEFREVETELRVISATLVLIAAIFAGYLLFRAFVPSPPGILDVAIPAGLAVACLILCAFQLHFLRSAIARCERRVATLAFMDDLTGVYNYHYLHTRLAQEMERARRYDHALSILYLDLDGLKRVNDLYGHQVGNEVLEQAGALLRASARENDLVGRVGGDEFLIILPETTHDSGKVVGERFRKAFAEHIFKTSASADIEFLTTSIGIAAFTPECSKSSDFLTAGDQAMYRAKQSGGNLVSS